MVPSIGSTIQRRPLSGASEAPYSSPTMASSGRICGQPVAQGPLDRRVGLAHRRQVGLGLDHQVGGAEALERDRVGHVGQLERQRQVLCGLPSRAVMLRVTAAGLGSPLA